MSNDTKVDAGRRDESLDTQCGKILTHIREHGSITPLEAIHLGCFRLAARVHELRGRGVPSVTRRQVHPGGTHARYELDENRSD